MDKNLAKQAQHFLNTRHQDRRRSQVLRGLAVVVALITVCALIMPAVTMSNPVECGLEEHVHGESCWTEQMASPQPQLVCDAGRSGGLVVHTHDVQCYDMGGGLACTLPELEFHIHDGFCYQEHQALSCQEIAEPGHTHSPACYTRLRGELQCGQEGGVHTHTEECYPMEPGPEPVCGRQEDEEHTHAAECYLVRVYEKMVCGLEESPDTTQTDEEGNVTVIPGHTHTESCRMPKDELCVCGLKEGQGHEHNDNCYGWTEELNCVETEREAGHVHGDECYEITQILACQKRETATHTHGEGCYGEDGTLVCGMEETVVHQHTADCFSTPEGGPEPVRTLVCGMEEHTHTEECYVEFEPVEQEIYYCGLDLHIHNEACFFESGALCCTLTEHVHDLTCLEPPVVETEEPEAPEESEGPEEPAQPVGVELDKDFETEIEGFRVTFHVKGFAPLTVEAEDEGIVVIQDEATPLAWSPMRRMALSIGVPQVSSADPDMENEAGPAAGPDLDDVADIIQDPLTQEPAPPAEPEYGDMDPAQPAPPMEWEDVGTDPVQSEFPTEPEGGDRDPVQAEPEPELLDPERVSVQVTAADRESDEFQRFAQFTEEVSGGRDNMWLTVLSYSLLYDGQPLDTSMCSVTAKITPTQELVESMGGAPVSAVEGGAPEEEPVQDEPEGEDSGSIMLVTMGMGKEDLEPTVQDIVTADADGADGISAAATLQNDGYVGFAATTGGDKISYEVQYYAYLTRLDTETGSPTDTKETKYLPFIDTSGHNRPSNGSMAPPTKYLKLETNTTNYIPNNTNGPSRGRGDKGTVQTLKELSRVYRERSVEFVRAMEGKLTTQFLDGVKNGVDDGTTEVQRAVHYELMEIWVTDGDGHAGPWTIYAEGDEAAARANFEAYKELCVKNGEAEPTLAEVRAGLDLDGIMYTNDAGKDDGSGTVVIKDEGTVIRMVYKTINENVQNPNVEFYDYDITDGKNNVVEKGINSGVNYPQGNSGAKLAFGNNNTGTGLGDVTWNGNTLNKSNGNTYEGLTFGLATGVQGGQPVFASGISAPALFDRQSGTGKHYFGSGNSLTFNRVGDTYTLTAAHGPGKTAANLEQFTYWQNRWKKTTEVWSNNFWPMDNSPGAADPMFNGGDGKFADSGKDYPSSDDGQAHNSYFGMTFSVGFNLPESYVGPLEYYFYGDDDMWVFLDGQLVCDIGGVHSSVGEYVDLWDYVPGGRENHQTASHTLQVFYTERGASGSSCWMQYTIPNMYQIPVPKVEQTVGLKIEKEVRTLLEADKDKDYGFTLELTNLQNMYRGQVYGADGQPVGEPIDFGSTAQGFTLKDGQYLLLSGLPEGTNFSVKETDKQGTAWTFVSKDEAGPVERDNEGGVLDKPMTEVLFLNGSDDVPPPDEEGYVLPETGGIGLYTWAGAPFLTAGIWLWYKKLAYGKGGAV